MVNFPQLSSILGTAKSNAKESSKVRIPPTRPLTIKRSSWEFDAWPPEGVLRSEDHQRTFLRAKKKDDERSFF